MDERPLIPYLHDSLHALRNTLAGAVTALHLMSRTADRLRKQTEDKEGEGL
jgi:hypothetical protein